MTTATGLVLLDLLLRVGGGSCHGASSDINKFLLAYMTRRPICQGPASTCRHLLRLVEPDPERAGEAPPGAREPGQLDPHLRGEGGRDGEVLEPERGVLAERRSAVAQLRHGARRRIRVAGASRSWSRRRASSPRCARTSRDRRRQPARAPARRAPRPSTRTGCSCGRSSRPSRRRSDRRGRSRATTARAPGAPPRSSLPDRRRSRAACPRSRPAHLPRSRHRARAPRAPWRPRRPRGGSRVSPCCGSRAPRPASSPRRRRRSRS